MDKKDRVSMWILYLLCLTIQEMLKCDDLIFNGKSFLIDLSINMRYKQIVFRRHRFLKSLLEINANDAKYIKNITVHLQLYLL